MSLCVPVTDYDIGVGGGQNTDFSRKDDMFPVICRIGLVGSGWRLKTGQICCKG